mgnify:CR=1 FL=1
MFCRSAHVGGHGHVDRHANIIQRLACINDDTAVGLPGRNIKKTLPASLLLGQALLLKTVRAVLRPDIGGSLQAQFGWKIKDQGKIRARAFGYGSLHGCEKSRVHTA